MKNNLKVQEIFTLAIERHKANNLEIAIDLYNKILEIDQNHVGAYHNLGVIFNNRGDSQKAKDYYEKVIKIDPNHVSAYNNLGSTFQALGDIQKAKDCYEKAIEINPDYAEAYNNLGAAYRNSKLFQKSINCYEKAIEIIPNYAAAYNNLGNTLQALGDIQKAKDCYEKAIEINPDYAEAYNNLGSTFSDLSDNQRAKDYYEKAIEIDPNHILSYWNLHSLASSTNEALIILKKLYLIDSSHIKTKIIISALEYYEGHYNRFNDLLESPLANHPYVRSAKWIFSLPKIPNVFFNRLHFFNAVIALSDKSRPFYEFGVWSGRSFEHLIKSFKKGFGFDTFTGLPEVWNDEDKGTYSNLGLIPKIDGGEFIAGKFEDTLPKFFSSKQPLASLINFDADLYSSTLCALKYSNKVIDDKTILIFDEFIMNDNWEQDEYKALNEFCDNLKISYEVIAVSFFTKQVAVKLKNFKS